MSLRVDKISLEELLTGCEDGIHRCQMEIYQRFHRTVFNSSYRILNNKVEAEDVMQETFLDCFNRLGELREKERFGGWIKRMAINKSLNELRKKDRYTVEIKESETAVVEDDYNEIDDLEVERVYACMKDLPEGYKAIVSMYLIEGYDHEEIGEILKVSSSTSRSQLTRAKIKIRQIYHEKFGKTTA